MLGYGKPPSGQCTMEEAARGMASVGSLTIHQAFLHVFKVLWRTASRTRLVTKRSSRPGMHAAASCTSHIEPSACSAAILKWSSSSAGKSAALQCSNQRIIDLRWDVYNEEGVLSFHGGHHGKGDA